MLTNAVFYRSLVFIIIMYRPLLGLETGGNLCYAIISAIKAIPTPKGRERKAAGLKREISRFAGLPKLEYLRCGGRIA